MHVKSLPSPNPYPITAYTHPIPNQLLLTNPAAADNPAADNASPAAAAALFAC